MTTTSSKKEREQLDRLTHALVDDIINTSDEDILAEAVEDYSDVSEAAAAVRALFDKTLLKGNKAKLSEAKAAVAANQRRPATIVSLDPAVARRRFEQIASKDPEMSRKLTLAARKEDGLSDEDIKSALEDLEELGALDDETNMDEDGKA